MPDTLLHPYGDHAWLVECEGDPIPLGRWLQDLPWPSPMEVVTGARTCLVRFDGPAPDRTTMESVLARASEAALPTVDGDALVTIRVRYTGTDLADVARLTGLTPDEVAGLHCSTTYRVALIGFAPGFAYLTGLPQQLHLPRRPVPRTRIPAGSVAIADTYTAVYPGASPGGWHLIGTTTQTFFDPDRDPPALLRAGMAVRFEVHQ